MSKAFLAVFEAHPNSIIQAIAYKVTGPALPQAMRVVRYRPGDAQLDVGEDPTTHQSLETDVEIEVPLFQPPALVHRLEEHSNGQSPADKQPW